MVIDVFESQTSFNLPEAFQIFLCGALWMTTLHLDDDEIADFVEEVLPDDDEIHPNLN